MGRTIVTFLLHPETSPAVYLSAHGSIFSLCLESLCSFYSPYKMCRQTLVTRAVWYIILPVEGVDFASSGSLIFNFEVGTATQACISITIIDDVDLEGDHSFDIILGANTPALGGGREGFNLPTSTTITIQDSGGMLA